MQKYLSLEYEKCVRTNKSSKKLTSMDFCSSEDAKLSYV